MRAKCYKCGWEWNYKGKSTVNLTCPSCLYKLRVEKALGKLPNKLPSYVKEVREKEKESVVKDAYANPKIIKANDGRVWIFPEIL